MTRVKLNERGFYEPVKAWLESRGYRTVITEGRKQIVLPTGTLLGVAFLEPDVIGYKRENGDHLVIVETKADPMFLFDGLGRCFVYRTVADYVYLAIPRKIADRIGAGSLFEERSGVGLGVGILAVDPETGEVEERVEAGEVDPRSWHGDLRKTLIGMVKSTLGIRE
jgi:hypothetical protein